MSALSERYLHADLIPFAREDVVSTRQCARPFASRVSGITVSLVGVLEDGDRSY